MINSSTPHYVFKSFNCSIKSVMLIIITTTNYKLQNVILNCKPCWLTNSILKWSRISGLSFHLFLLLSSFHLSQVLKGHREKRGERRVQLKNKKTTKKKKHQTHVHSGIPSWNDCSDALYERSRACFISRIYKAHSSRILPKRGNVTQLSIYNW